MARLVEHDVRRLHVPVHDMSLVEGVETGGELACELQDVLDWERALRVDALGEGPAGDVTRCEVVTALDLAGLDDGYEILVLDLGGHPSLPEKAPSVHVTLGQRLAKDLERDGAAEPGVLGPIDDAHCALAEQLPLARMGPRGHQGR